MKSSQQKVITTLAVLIVIVAIVAGVGLANKKKATNVATTTTTSQPTSTNTSGTNSTGTSTTSSGTFKDGTYTATGGFNTPSGPDDLSVSLTIKDGVITTSTVTGNSTDRESEEYDQRFISSYQQYVNGKNIANLNLSRVAGASLTSIGFNNALQQIKSDATA